MKSPKELKEWRQQMKKGRKIYILSGMDPVGARGMEFHINTHGHIDALMNEVGWDGVTYRQRRIDAAKSNAAWAVEKAIKLARKG